jgi:hypothetical protein
VTTEEFLAATPWARSSTRPELAASTVEHGIRGRMLTVVGKKPEATAAHLDRDRGGLILTGAKGHDAMRSLRAQMPDLVMLREPTSVMEAASPDAPLALDTAGLVPEDLGLVLDGQLEYGASFAVTPTRFIQPGDADSMKAALDAVNRLQRRDVIFLLPIHYRWLSSDSVKQLIAVAKRCDHPVALAVGDSWGNPLEHRGAVQGYSRFFEEVPWAMPWRADLGAFGAIAHGAHGAAIGNTPALRRLAVPGIASRAQRPTERQPHVLLTRLLRYSRSSEMQQKWFASASPEVCHCPYCDGAAVDRFSGSDGDRRQAHLHNLHQIKSLHMETRGRSEVQIQDWWRQAIQATQYEAQALSGRLGVQISPPKDLLPWLDL